MRIKSKGANDAGNKQRWGGPTGNISWEYVSEKQADMPFLGWSQRVLSESSPWHFWWCIKNFIIGAQLLYNVVLVFVVQGSESALWIYIYIYIYIPSLTSLPTLPSQSFRSSQNKMMHLCLTLGDEKKYLKQSYRLQKPNAEFFLIKLFTFLTHF